MSARAEDLAKKLEASCRELNAETLALLKTSGDNAAAVVCGLSDSERDRSGSVLVGAPAMTAAQAIDGILINHVREHLASTRATTGAK